MDQRNAQEKLLELGELRAFLEQQIRLIDDEAHVIQKAMTLVQQPTEIGVHVTKASDNRCPADREGQFGLSPYQHAGPRRSHIEIAKDVALAHGGVVHLTSVARDIISSGMSHTKKSSSVAANLHRAMKKSRDWEWIKPGVFRLLSYNPPAEDGDIRPQDNRATV